MKFDVSDDDGDNLPTRAAKVGVCLCVSDDFQLFIDSLVVSALTSNVLLMNLEQKQRKNAQIRSIGKMLSTRSFSL